jgi:hypothetical protein
MAVSRQTVVQLQRKIGAARRTGDALMFPLDFQAARRLSALEVLREHPLGSDMYDN